MRLIPLPKSYVKWRLKSALVHGKTDIIYPETLGHSGVRLSFKADPQKIQKVINEKYCDRSKGHISGIFLYRPDVSDWIELISKSGSHKTMKAIIEKGPDFRNSAYYKKLQNNINSPEIIALSKKRLRTSRKRKYLSSQEELDNHFRRYEIMIANISGDQTGIKNLFQVFTFKGMTLRDKIVTFFYDLYDYKLRVAIVDGELVLVASGRHRISTYQLLGKPFVNVHVVGVCPIWLTNEMTTTDNPDPLDALSRALRKFDFCHQEAYCK